jgi:hypothetical protein
MRTAWARQFRPVVLGTAVLYWLVSCQSPIEPYSQFIRFVPQRQRLRPLSQVPAPGPAATGRSSLVAI